MRRKNVTIWFTTALSLLCLTACGGSTNAVEGSSGNAEIQAADSENQEITENKMTENEITEKEDAEYKEIPE